MHWPVPSTHRASLGGWGPPHLNERTELCTWGPLLGCTCLCLSHVKRPWGWGASTPQGEHRIMYMGPPSWYALACAHHTSSVLGRWGASTPRRENSITYMGPPPGMHWPVPITHQASLGGGEPPHLKEKTALRTWAPLLGCTGLCLSHIKRPWGWGGLRTSRRTHHYVHGPPSWYALTCAYHTSSVLGGWGASTPQGENIIRL